MIEPTESESKKEIDRFCFSPYFHPRGIRQAEQDKSQNAILKSAPHSLKDALQEKWPFPYSKQKAFYPLPWLQERKFWPPVSRIENAFGDINPFCSCPSPIGRGAKGRRLLLNKKSLFSYNVSHYWQKMDNTAQSYSDSPQSAYAGKIKLNLKDADGLIGMYDKSLEISKCFDKNFLKHGIHQELLGKRIKN